MAGDRVGIGGGADQVGGVSVAGVVARGAGGGGGGAEDCAGYDSVSRVSGLREMEGLWVTNVDTSVVVWVTRVVSVTATLETIS